jgi:DNA-binding SARP family transcriptional activator
MRFLLLGPVTVLGEHGAIRLAAKPRALLALLVLDANRVVSSDRLVDELWGERPPETGPKTLQVYVSQLRKALGADRVETHPGGYLLRADKDEVDVAEFEALFEAAREQLAAGDPAEARPLLVSALELWRGAALADLVDEPFARQAAARLEELRLAALEERIDSDLALGREGVLVPEVEQLAREHPLRERLRGQLMLALYRAGRQADALAVYRETRRALADELGIEPGTALQQLERGILNQEPDLLRPAPAPAAAAAPAPPSEGASRPRRLRLLVAAAVLAAAVAGLVAALVLLRGGGGTAAATSTRADPELKSFVFKVENFLRQSQEGRREIGAAVFGALECSVPPPVAAVRLNRIQENRQSLLQQLAALRVPGDDRALRASDLLQKAAHASIAADWHYRDWLRTLKACPRHGPPAEATAADARATRAKKAFLAVFNPLARRFGQRPWTASDF